MVKPYPKPVNKGLLNIPTIVKIDKLQVFDLNGKMVHQEPSLGTNKQIDLGKLSKGLYLVRVTKDQYKNV